jgi:DNA-binding Lrp family transcriptional regulator
MQSEIHLKLLQRIEKNPQITQREMSHTLEVSLDKFYFCLKALKDKVLVRLGKFSNNPNKNGGFKCEVQHVL